MTRIPICELKEPADCMYRVDGKDSILIFQDSSFNSDLLLLCPPNKIAVPQELSFNAKVVLISTSLNMELFKITTQIVLGDYVCYPEVVLIDGYVKFIIKRFNQDYLPCVPYKNVSFYRGSE